MAQKFFYDSQIRRFLLQFARIFSNFEVEFNRTAQGTYDLVRVPVRYGDPSRQAQTVLQDNSASNTPTAPLMAFYITAMDYDRTRIQEPYHVNRIAVKNRRYDPETMTYETTPGTAFTVERLMPVPWLLTLNLDIWTSNTNQKWQLLEQIGTLFNPSLEIQSTDNYLDWTSLSVVELDSSSYSSRTVPQGAEDALDVTTLRFRLPIWISSPAKVKKLGVVEKIVACVFDEQGDANEALLDNDLLLGTRQKITPGSYQVLLIGNRLQALAYNQVINPTDDNTQPQTSPDSNVLWHAVVEQYGVLRSGISQVRLADQWGGDNEVIGTVSYDPTDDRFLLFDVDEDTVPQNTLAPVNAVIDPLAAGPGAGLPQAVAGQRYLLLEAVGDWNNPQPALAWGILVAEANDIIEFDGVLWQRVFVSREAENTQFVTNITTGLQYRWTGAEWVKSYEGLYPGGEWSLVL